MDVAIVQRRNKHVVTIERRHASRVCKVDDAFEVVRDLDRDSSIDRSPSGVR